MQRLAIGTELAGHLTDGSARRVQAGGLLVARLPPRMSRLLALLGRWGHGWDGNSGRRADGAGGPHVLADPPDHSMMALHHRLDGLAEVA
jgi:hypothetical protein